MNLYILSKLQKKRDYSIFESHPFFVCTLEKTSAQAPGVFSVFKIAVLVYIIVIRGTKSKNKTQLSKLGRLNYPVSSIIKKSVQKPVFFYKITLHKSFQFKYRLSFCSLSCILRLTGFILILYSKVNISILGVQGI